MRTIQFRGKRVDNGEWVYGYPIIVSYKAWIKDINDTTTNPRRLGQDSADFRCVEVEKETVVQYTGHKDKNGVEIYEGDVLQMFSVFVAKPIIVEIYFDENWAKFSSKDKLISPTKFDESEVIGNIHDNPELMNE